MRNKKMHAILGLCAATLAGPALALEIDPLVPPEINLGGRALGTLNAEHTSGADGDETDAEMDISDSSLLLGFAKYLFDDARYGFGAVGLTVPEDGSEIEGELFIHELHAGIGGRDYQVKLGRSRMRNSLIRFPTIRDDDLLAFTHVPNASSHAEAELYHIFANLADVEWWLTPRIATHAALTARIETDPAGDVTASSEFNGANVGLAYDVPGAIRFDRGLRYAGLALDSQDVDELDDRLHALIAGLVYNLNSYPERQWVLELQGIATRGLEAAALDSEAGRNRADSDALVGALRYIHRPYLQTRWQAALVAAWEDYREFDDAARLAVAPSFVYRLGSNVDWVTQYIYTRNRGLLADATGIEEAHRLYTGFAFGFAHTFNESVGQRRSILAIEHDMAVSGPVFGDH